MGPKKSRKNVESWLLTVWRPASALTPHTSHPCAALPLQPSSVGQEIMHQFAQTKTLLTSFLGYRQESTRTTFCNYLVSEVEHLEERDFQSIRNEAVKLLSGIQNRPEQSNHQPQLSTLSRSSGQYHFHICAPDLSAAAAAASAREYIFTIPETQMPVSQVI